MTAQDGVTYSGPWVPVLTETLLLERHGELFLYLYSEMHVLVEMSESEFYMKNVQESISRAYEGVRSQDLSTLDVCCCPSSVFRIRHQNITNHH